MQAIDHNGKGGTTVPYDPKAMEEWLRDPNVKEVRVFKLKKGMTINIEGVAYKVTAVRANGKVTMKLK